MPRPTIASLQAEIAALKAQIAALTPKAAPAADTDHVVLWKNDAQRRFWFEKACHALGKEFPARRSFSRTEVDAKAIALSEAAAARREAQH